MNRIMTLSLFCEIKVEKQTKPQTYESNMKTISSLDLATKFLMILLINRSFLYKKVKLTKSKFKTKFLQ